MSRVLLTLAKYGISLGLIGFLLYRDRENFGQVFTLEKRWDLLVATLFFAVLANLITFVRWWWLVRAVQMPLAVNQAIGLGFLGYLFNFLSLGVVGGDALKAVFLARQLPGHKAEAVASVIIDRALGLYALFVVAAIGATFVDFDQLALSLDPEKLAAVKRLGFVVNVIVVVGAVAALVIMGPAFRTSPVDSNNEPKLAPGIFGRLLDVARIYRRRWALVVGAGMVSLGVHVANTLSIYLVARGLGFNDIRLSHLFVAGPLAMVAGAVPLPGGLGAFEFAYDALYRALTGSAGLATALGYRAVTLVVAVLGMGYYLAHRREVSDLVHEVEVENAAG